jgi:hypothetical protein
MLKDHETAKQERSQLKSLMDQYFQQWSMWGANLEGLSSMSLRSVCFSDEDFYYSGEVLKTACAFIRHAVVSIFWDLLQPLTQ